MTLALKVGIVVLICRSVEGEFAIERIRERRGDLREDVTS